jgi:uncharacterized membrane protein YgdD (TMEM256/DUF423 family)
MDQRNGLGKFVGGIGFVGIAIGAFGAHGLKESLSPEMMAIYQTGVLYHLIHSAALLAILCAPDALWNTPWPKRICRAWIAGIIIFSGSLYALAISGIKVLGAITPIGGVAFLIGWFMVMFLFSQKHNPSND